ncbi:hypothetical protein MPSI1_001496 [Malassezia psittaci]|uniref:SH3 domain-containing protein n=1 Tax=Malassezia psittaci TaxID=1821823 RepID=A0AAF0F4H6_9BASI|nr:hypothetical protein MPSI1_001496 [Malassezia psittaci]
MESDVRRARKILDKFCPPGTKSSLDKVIPVSVMRKAKGIAIQLYGISDRVPNERTRGNWRGPCQATERRYEWGADVEWSAPTAIGIGGLGGGFNAGAEMVDFLIVLNSRAAVKSFMSSGSLQLGGNLGLALGPLGRSGEASAALNSEMKVSAMFSYSMSRGLYGGITIEGTVLLERPESNRKVYGDRLTSGEILAGNAEVPQFALSLTERLAEITDNTAYPESDPMTTISDNSDSDIPSIGNARVSRKSTSTRRNAPLPPQTRDTMDDLDAQLQSSSLSSEMQSRYKSRFDVGSSYNPRRDASYRTESVAQQDAIASPSAYKPYESRRKQRATVVNTPSEDSQLTDDPFADPEPEQRTGSNPKLMASETKLLDLDEDVSPEGGSELRYKSSSKAAARPMGNTSSSSSTNAAYIPPALLEGDLVVALHDFHAQEPTDLSFQAGDIIRVTRRTDNEEDWWTGELAAAFGDEQPPSGSYV